MEKRSLAAVLAALAMLAPATGAEYLVDATDFRDAIAAARAGDVITFRDGVYNNVAIDFRPAENGRADAPITLRAQTQGGVVFRGNGSKLRINRDWLVVDGFVWEDVTVNGSNDYVIRFNSVDDTVFRNNTLRRVYNHNLDAAAVRVAVNSNRNIIERNEFTAPDDSEPYRMIQVWAYKDSTPSLDNVVRHNYFHDMGRALQLGQGANTSPPDPFQRTTIEANLFERMHNYTVHMKTSGNLLKDNTVRDARSAADVRTGRQNDYIGNFFFDALPIALLHGDGEVRNNYFEGGFNTTDRGEAINLGWGDVPYPQISQANPAEGYLIENNTILGFADAGIDFDLRRGVSGHSLPPKDNTFVENLIWSTAGKAIDLKGATDQTWEGNVVWATGSGSPGSTPTGVRVVDPGLKRNALGLLYSENFPDVGADVSRRPLTAADVGPGSTFTYDNYLAGDFNSDGVVDAADYTVWRDTRGLGGPGLAADANADGFVGSTDYAVWRERFGRTLAAAPSTESVPEPAAAAAATQATLAWAVLRRARRSR
ncbi:chondroitinase-B domain-containing protein [Botrimarina sp.]|uniref:chondroitinase-B domain-containing protein n=1 Tax=Botrimarina sp. TaxID=2795802 RepID=UPI0032EE7167